MFFRRTIGMDWRQHKINACRRFHADCPLPYNYDKKDAVARKRYIVREKKVAVAQRYLHFFSSWTFHTKDICIFSKKRSCYTKIFAFFFQLDVLLMQSCYFFSQLELSHKDICIFHLISLKNFCHDTSMSNQPLQNLWNIPRLNSTRIRNIINWYQLQSVSD